MDGKKCRVIFLLPIVVENVGNMAAIRSLKWHRFSLKMVQKSIRFVLLPPGSDWLMEVSIFCFQNGFKFGINWDYTPIVTLGPVYY